MPEKYDRRCFYYVSIRPFNPTSLFCLFAHRKLMLLSPHRPINHEQGRPLAPIWGPCEKVGGASLPVHHVCSMSAQEVIWVYADPLAKLSFCDSSLWMHQRGERTNRLPRMSSDGTYAASNGWSLSYSRCYTSILWQDTSPFLTSQITLVGGELKRLPGQ